MARFIIATLTAVALAGCGGSDAAPSTDPGDTAPAATAAPTTPADTTPTTAPAATAPPATAPAATTPAATAPPATAPADTTPDTTSPPAGTISVSLAEWEIVAPTAIPAGPTTFAITNDGDFRHHFGVARGNSYDELPQLPSGAIDEAALGDDYLGRSENIEFAESATVDFDLTPGNYVFFCNIVAGPTSHAAQGQVLPVTVG